MQNAESKKRQILFAVCAACLVVISSIGAIVIISHLTSTQHRVPSSTSNTKSNSATTRVGATLPYIEMEAHSANTNGTVLGPDYQLGDLASDGVDRTIVQLTQGKSVQFTLPQKANSINLRYSIPDSPSGGGINASLSIYINGTKQANDLQLTSKYSWLYGGPDFSNCNANAWSKSPGGTPHQFDEVHTFLPQMAAGTTVKLQVDAENTAHWYAIDVADFQQVAPHLPSRRATFQSLTRRIMLIQRV